MWAVVVSRRRGAAGGALNRRRRRSGGDRRGGRVQEVQGGNAELAEGSVGREEERKRELRGSLGMGGANGRRRRLWTPRRARLGAWSREGSRGGGRRPVCAAREGRRARLECERAGEKNGARHWSARSSPWHADGSPRRACKEMAPRGDEKLQEGPGRSGWWHGEGAARGHRPRRPAQIGEGERGKERVEREI